MYPGFFYKNEIRRALRKNPSKESIIKLFSRWNWNVVYFDLNQNDELINRFKVNKMAKSNRAFTLRYHNTYVIFIRDDQTNKDTIKLLLHEAGHILYGHNFKNISPDDELEANTFMASCLKDYRYKTKIIVVFSLFILAVIIVKNGDLTSQAPRSSQLSQLDSSCNYYSGASIPADYVVITGTGDKYHRPNCQYVQGKTNLLTLATEEAMQLGKQPCKVCNPDR